MDLPTYATMVGKRVEDFIYSIISGSPRRLYEASLHYVRAGGKRLRPLVVVLASRIAGGTEEVAIPAAAAVEVVHTFTLIHDDIIDKDEMRRGVPTVHKLWGTEMAIVAGDLLFAYAYRCLHKALELGVPADRVGEAYRMLTEAVILVAEGQAMDMMLAESEEVKIEDYLVMVAKKTAALFAYAASIGAVIAGGEAEIVERLHSSLLYAGIAFQIRDDVLGLLGDERTLGKPTLSDIREGKKTLPVIYALRALAPEQKNKLRGVLGKRSATQEELRSALELIKSCNAIEFAERVADDYAERALNAAEGITNPKDAEALRLLKELIVFMVRRAL